MAGMICAISCFISLNAFAHGDDYSTSFYGDKAQELFDASTKITDTCTYAQADVNDQGNLGDKLNPLIGDHNINSVMCVRIGEQTYACEGLRSEYSLVFESL
jgi:hypothetical protein